MNELERVLRDQQEELESTDFSQFVIQQRLLLTLLKPIHWSNAKESQKKVHNAKGLSRKAKNTVSSMRVKNNNNNLLKQKKYGRNILRFFRPYLLLLFCIFQLSDDV